MHITGLPVPLFRTGMLLTQIQAEQVTCTPVQPIGVSADEEVCCIGEWRQGLTPERQRAHKYELRNKIAELMRQRGRTLKLIKCVESLMKGDE